MATVLTGAALDKGETFSVTEFSWSGGDMKEGVGYGLERHLRQFPGPHSFLTLRVWSDGDVWRGRWFTPEGEGKQWL